MRFAVTVVGALLLLASRPVYAQGSGSGGLVATMGYAMPTPRAVAPGQVISLFLRAGSAPAASLLASDVPLAAVQAGYIVVLEQSTALALVEVPLLGVSRAESCYGMLPCTPLTILTVQIPWELRPNVNGQGRPDNFVSIRVRAAGSEAGEVFPVRPVRDAIHIVSTCEESPFLQAPPESAAGGGVCRSRVTHADGRLVTAANPAAAGETVLVHGVGFGTMEGRPETGVAAGADVAVENVQLAVEFGSNLAARRPDGSATATTGILKAGQFGMYVVAVTVPEIPAGTPACTASRIQSNLTVSIGRLDSFAGAAFCVDTGAEP
jgi:uncharacterized protein (TIGR03437 family)